MTSRYVWLSVLTLVFGACGSDRTGPDDGPLPGDLTLALQPFVTTGLASPVFMAQPLDDGRVFVVEQAGLIRVVLNGELQPTPFLNIDDRVLSGGERGLLSVAFHPQYNTNRFFYVYYTAEPSGDLRIERYTTTAGNAGIADPASSRLIITTPHPVGNHNGGLVAFGPDGMLWAAFGDGGGGGDPDGNGQNFNALLGSMLRLNVNGTNPYDIPPDNPFVGQAGRRGEIWAKGLRNPWRFAFDAPTGILYIADVGQDAREEVNARRDDMGGLNYGWNRMEGFACFSPATGCNQAGLTLPVIDYAHGIGGICSVTGGYVYRGSAIEGLQGHYLYSDLCGRWLRSFRYSNGAAVDEKDWGILVPGSVTSFGVDFAGELYVIGGSSIYRIIEGT
ncbi:MAG TPA: PQQ-dependent sugar dehydrogenase [Gemmatimonadaceae bacterium]|nr:PQQ-dependent sugar dehydrogenase [Gemmatimonadaceae bacterium]